MYTPGPWHACRNGICSCGQVWCSDYPVAEITRGEWGDTYPAIRLTDGTSMSRVAEAYMEKIVYGSISDEMATANARLIAAAPDLYSAIKNSDDASWTPAMRAAIVKVEKGDLEHEEHMTELRKEMHSGHAS